MAVFRGKPPGSGSGEMSKRTEALRPHIGLTPKQASEARRLRRAGHEPEQVAAALALPREEVEKALVQMRSPRPETTRGTLNVTLAAHRLIAQERHGDETVWQTVDRLLDELLKLRAASDTRESQPKVRRHAKPEDRKQPLLFPDSPQ